MDEKKDMQFATGIEIELATVNIESNPKDNNEILKITFETNKGNITWKPKVFKEHRVSGIAVKDKVPMTIEEMPEKLRKLGSLAYEKGNVTMLVNYTVWNTEMDGEAVTYRFITSEKTFNEWTIVDEKVPEEKVE